MYVNTFTTSYEYQEWTRKRRGEIQVISTVAFKNEIVVTYNTI